MTTQQRIEFYQKWIAALRSGKYKKGMMFLLDESKDGGVLHCTLGVACSVAGYDPFIDGWMMVPTYFMHMPYELRGVTEVTKDIVEKNGMADMPFSAIADYIETAYLNPLIEMVFAKPVLYAGTVNLVGAAIGER